jgi:hypothetical protein
MLRAFVNCTMVVRISRIHFSSRKVVLAERKADERETSGGIVHVIGKREIGQGLPVGPAFHPPPPFSPFTAN